MPGEDREKPNIGTNINNDTRFLAVPKEKVGRLRFVGPPTAPEHLVRNPVVRARPQTQRSTVWKHILHVIHSMKMAHDGVGNTAPNAERPSQ